MQHLSIFNLLPKTDCRKCGHDTCLVFAMKLAQGRATIEACPETPKESAKAILAVILSERGVVSSLWKAVGEVKQGEIKSALLLLHDAFIKVPRRAVNFLLITFPLSIPIALIIIWLCMR